jgi:hypothetical protein
VAQIARWFCGGVVNLGLGRPFCRLEEVEGELRGSWRKESDRARIGRGGQRCNREPVVGRRGARRIGEGA